MALRLAQPKEVPALCPNCGYVFNSHMGFFEHPVEIIDGVAYYNTLATSPTQIFDDRQVRIDCPVCKYKKAELRSDLFEFVRETFNDLKQLGHPEIVYLENLFKKLGTNFTEENFAKAEEEAESKIKGLTIFKLFRKYLKDPSTGNIIGLLSLITSIIGIFLTCIGSKEEPKIINIYNITLNQNLKDDSTNKTNDTVKTVPRKIKIGRNDPCTCGSGKKFKSCCGRN